jgi:hypothetical protein
MAIPEAQLETFKKQLEEWKEETGNENLDVEGIVSKVKEQEPEEREVFNKEAFYVLRLKLDELVKDYEDFNGPKGRKLNIIFEVEKENAADRYAEEYNFGENMRITVITHIGTKGKYQKMESMDR